MCVQFVIQVVIFYIIIFVVVIHVLPVKMQQIIAHPVFQVNMYHLKILGNQIFLF